MLRRTHLWGWSSMRTYKKKAKINKVEKGERKDSLSNIPIGLDPDLEILA